MTNEIKKFKNLCESKDRYMKCRKFFDELAKELTKDYEVVASCNKDLSAYLVPRGTKEEISYYGKPERSFRVSDHWNWYSNLKKCSAPEHVQCHNMDIEKPIERDFQNPSMATQGRQACQVAYYINGKYYGVYGEFWNPETKEYEWWETDVSSALGMIGYY